MGFEQLGKPTVTICECGKGTIEEYFYMDDWNRREETKINCNECIKSEEEKKRRLHIENEYLRELSEESVRIFENKYLVFWKQYSLKFSNKKGTMSFYKRTA